MFCQLELVEQRGLGFTTMKELPEKFDIPLPLVEYQEPYMVFTFPRSGESLKKISPIKTLKNLNDEELKGYDFVRLKGKLNRKEYEEHFGFEKKKAERHFKVFVEQNLVERKGSGPGTYYEAIAT